MNTYYAFPAKEEFGDFLRDCRNSRQAENNSPFPQAHEMGIENPLQERNGTNEQKQENRRSYRILHPLIGENADAEE
jgi:hypothetical protein